MAKLDGLMDAADHPATFFVAIAFIVTPVIIGTILLFQWLGLLGPGALGRG